MNLPTYLPACLRLLDCHISRAIMHPLMLFWTLKRFFAQSLRCWLLIKIREKNHKTKHLLIWTYMNIKTHIISLTTFRMPFDQHSLGCGIGRACIWKIYFMLTGETIRIGNATGIHRNRFTITKVLIVSMQLQC